MFSQYSILMKLLLVGDTSNKDYTLYLSFHF